MDPRPPSDRPYDPRIDDDSVRVLARWALWELTARETRRGRLVYYEVRFLLSADTLQGVMFAIAAAVAILSSAAVLRDCPP